MLAPLWPVAQAQKVNQRIFVDPCIDRFESALVGLDVIGNLLVFAHAVEAPARARQLAHVGPTTVLRGRLDSRPVVFQYALHNDAAVLVPLAQQVLLLLAKVHKSVMLRSASHSNENIAIPWLLLALVVYRPAGAALKVDGVQVPRLPLENVLASSDLVRLVIPRENEPIVLVRESAGKNAPQDEANVFFRVHLLESDDAWDVLRWLRVHRADSEDDLSLSHTQAVKEVQVAHVLIAHAQGVKHEEGGLLGQLLGLFERVVGTAKDAVRHKLAIQQSVVERVNAPRAELHVQAWHSEELELPVNEVAGSCAALEVRLPAARGVAHDEVDLEDQKQVAHAVALLAHQEAVLPKCIQVAL
mmetsp:Transcript_20339/g.51595  ORF Transcript_20339/g.51595 Transcript_20339/m.51595 type:complete len:358 (+) Transcript_20339:338-1411(+)